MDECASVKGSASYGTLSPQQSQTSSYSSPEMVDLYLNSSSFGGKHVRPSSPGLSSSFVLITDESAYGQQSVDIPLNHFHGRGNAGEASAPTDGMDGHPERQQAAALITNGRTNDSIESVLDVSVNTSAPRSSTQRIESGTADRERNVLLGDSSGAMPPSCFDSFERVALLSTNESGAEVVDKSTQASLPEPGREKEGPLCVTATDRFQVELSPLGSPSEEIVDMSASTVLVERHISQKEGRILKNNNKELRLKIKKLTEILEQLQNENKKLKNDLESKSDDDIMSIRSALEDNERELKTTLELLEQLNEENKRLNEELRSKNADSTTIQAAVKEKDREWRKRLEDLEEQQELELDQYRERLQSAVEYEAVTKPKLEEIADEIAELKSTVVVLQQQLSESQKEVERSAEKTSLLIAKLQASETKRKVVESENSVLSEKVNHLMKELSALKHGSAAKHHHDKKVAGAAGSEDVKSKQAEPVKRDHHPDTSQQGHGATRHDETSLKHEVRSCPKPKPRQKYYEAHHPNRINDEVVRVKQREASHKPKPVQALVAPKLQSVAHLQRQLQGASAKYSPSHDPVPSGAAGYDSNRPSHVPIRGQNQAPPAALVPQTKPTPPLSDAQKLAATASWVQQLPEPQEREKERVGETPAGTGGDKGTDLSSLSEERIEEITRQLKGGKVIECECPICGKMLHSRESDYGLQLHVEMCLKRSEENH